jgi:hypothetical protein
VDVSVCMGSCCCIEVVVGYVVVDDRDGLLILIKMIIPVQVQSSLSVYCHARIVIKV